MVVNQTSIITDKKLDLVLVFQKGNSVLIQYAEVVAPGLLSESLEFVVATSRL